MGRLSLSQVIGALDHGQLVHLSSQPDRPARLGSLSRPLPALLAERLPPGGLWSHQAEAVDLARAGRSVAVATATASGKSLCFQLPVAEAVLNGAGAILVYPTKALGPRPAGSPHRPRCPRPGSRHLRRGQLARRADVGPSPRQRRSHQPRQLA